MPCATLVNLTYFIALLLIISVARTKIVFAFLRYHDVQVNSELWSVAVIAWVADVFEIDSHGDHRVSESLTMIVVTDSDHYHGSS